VARGLRQGPKSRVPQLQALVQVLHIFVWEPYARGPEWIKRKFDEALETSNTGYLTAVLVQRRLQEI
jgi:hypothetical protein